MRKAALLLATLLLVGCVHSTGPQCKPCSHYLPEGLDKPSTRNACLTAGTAAVPGNGEPYTNLVFQGGGVKGVAYAGAMAAFGDERLDEVESIAGTSAGAITALVLALGYDSEQLCKINLHTDFKEFKDGKFFGDVDRLVKHYGWYKGDQALCMLQCLVEDRTGSKETNFAELEALRQEHPEKKYKHLYVFGTNVNTHQSVTFSHRNRADTPLAQAVRASMSIPLFFAAEEIEGDLFVDGGALRNYPIDFFDDLAGSEHEADPNTLGFHLGAEPRRGTIDGLRRFTEELAVTVLNSQVDQTCHTPHDVRRSIFIDTRKVSATDFDILPKERLELIEQGRKATEAYLGETEHSLCCPEFMGASPSAQCPL